MPKLAVLGAAIILTSCGGFKLFANQTLPPAAKLSPAPMERLAMEENQLIIKELDKKLFSLHSYFIIGQRNLVRLDTSLKDLNFDQPYRSYTYLSLMAVRPKVQKLEEEILTLSRTLSTKKLMLMTERVREFSSQSSLQGLSIKRISETLHVNAGAIKQFSSEDIETEYKRLLKTKEFHVYEKNVEHHAHLQQTKLKNPVRSPASIDEDKATEWSVTFKPINEKYLGPGDIDSFDWLAQTPEKIVERSLKMIKKSKRTSGFIVFHQNHQQSREVSAKIKDFLNHRK